MSDDMEVDSDGEQQLDSSAEQDETSINLIAGKIVEIHLKNFLRTLRLSFDQVNSWIW